MENKITLEHIYQLIKLTHYWNNGKTTICILTLINGFEVVGTSSVVDSTQFDEKIGNKIAYDNAINKIWELEGYRLQWHLYKEREVEKILCQNIKNDAIRKERTSAD